MVLWLVAASGGGGGYASVCAKICCRPDSQHILEEEFDLGGA